MFNAPRRFCWTEVRQRDVRLPVPIHAGFSGWTIRTRRLSSRRVSEEPPFPPLLNFFFLPLAFFFLVLAFSRPPLHPPPLALKAPRRCSGLRTLTFFDRRSIFVSPFSRAAASIIMLWAPNLDLIIINTAYHSDDGDVFTRHSISFATLYVLACSLALSLSLKLSLQ